MNLRLKVKVRKLQEDIKELELQDNEDGTVNVMLGDWSLVTFGINDAGKIAFARNTCVEEAAVDTDRAGRIEEVDEGKFVELD